MWQQILEILSVLGLSAVKFLAGAPLALGYGYNLLQTFIIITIGGWIGVLTFSFFGAKIDTYFDKRSEKKHTKKFTLKNKLIVKVRRATGMIGIVAITAPIISIPVGVLISARMFTDKKKLLTYHLIAIPIWGVILSVFFKYVKDLILG